MICGRRCCWLRTSFCWKKGGWWQAPGRRNFCGCSIRKCWRSRLLWMSGEAPHDGALEIHGGAPVRDPECDAGACRTCVHCDGGCDFDWSDSGDGDCKAGEASRACAGDCGDISDDTEFGAVRVFDTDSVYRRNRKADRDCGADAVCAAADPAEYVCWVDGD